MRSNALLRWYHLNWYRVLPIVYPEADKAAITRTRQLVPVINYLKTHTDIDHYALLEYSTQLVLEQVKTLFDSMLAYFTRKRLGWNSSIQFLNNQLGDRYSSYRTPYALIDVSPQDQQGLVIAYQFVQKYLDILEQQIRVYWELRDTASSPTKVLIYNNVLGCLIKQLHNFLEKLPLWESKVFSELQTELRKEQITKTNWLVYANSYKATQPTGFDLAEMLLHGGLGSLDHLFEDKHITAMLRGFHWYANARFGPSIRLPRATKLYYSKQDNCIRPIEYEILATSQIHPYAIWEPINTNEFLNKPSAYLTNDKAIRWHSVTLSNTPTSWLLNSFLSEFGRYTRRNTTTNTISGHLRKLDRNWLQSDSFRVCQEHVRQAQELHRQYHTVGQRQLQNTYKKWFQLHLLKNGYCYGYHRDMSPYNRVTARHWSKILLREDNSNWGLSGGRMYGDGLYMTLTLGAQNYSNMRVDYGSYCWRYKVALSKLFILDPWVVECLGMEFNPGQQLAQAIAAWFTAMQRVDIKNKDLHSDELQRMQKIAWTQLDKLRLERIRGYPTADMAQRVVQLLQPLWHKARRMNLKPSLKNMDLFTVIPGMVYFGMNDGLAAVVYQLPKVKLQSETLWTTSWDNPKDVKWKHIKR